MLKLSSAFRKQPECFGYCLHLLITSDSETDNKDRVYLVPLSSEKGGSFSGLRC